MARATSNGRSKPPMRCGRWKRRSNRLRTDRLLQRGRTVSTLSAANASPSGAMKTTVVGTILLGAFVFSLNARGTILESELEVQAFELDHYKIQWITGLEGIAGLTSLFSSIYLIKVFGARRVFLAGTICLAV